MKRICLCISLKILLIIPSSAQSAGEKEKVLQVVQQFFNAMENLDSLSFRNVFLPDARNYYILKNDSISVGSQNPFDFKLKEDLIIRESMRKEGVIVQVHQNIAMVWAPYDLWVNGNYSHCGVDVFTLLNTKKGWKIASLSYTIEKEGCD